MTPGRADDRYAERQKIAVERGFPVIEDIGELDGLDQEAAVRNFLGKSVEEAEAMFRSNFLRYGEDLMWMKGKAFCFYVEAAVAYLMSPAADGDSDAVNGFQGTVAFRVEHDRDEVAPALPRLRAACEYLLANLERYDVDPEIYGDVPAALTKLRHALG